MRDDSIHDVVAERRRQIEEEGWTPEHDDEHRDGEMALAAACYLSRDRAYPTPGLAPPEWPWDWKWWKPRDRYSNLKRAAALVVAEMDRERRATSREKERDGAD
jgi:hypothetical protein